MPSNLIGDLEGFDPAALDALGPRDVAALADRALDDADPNRASALQLLALLDPEGTLAVAGRIVSEGASPALMATAIRAAGAAEDDAIPLLSAFAAAPDPAVALAAWATLAQIARSNDLPALEALAGQTSGIVAAQASFTLTVVANRSGATGFEVPMPADTLEVDLMLPLASIDSGPVSGDDFALLARMPRRERYLVGLDQDHVTAIDCGGAHMLLVTDADFLGALVDVLLPSPALAGIVVLRDRTGTSYSVRYLVITSPDGAGGLLVSVHQTGGTQVYFGAAEVTGSEATLTLRTVAHPGAVPIQVTAVVAGTGISFAEAHSSQLVAMATPKLDLEADAD
jgi:hypothetical protein